MEHSRNQHFLFCRLPQIHNVYLRTINDCMFGRKWEYIPTSQKKFLVPKIGNDTGNTGYLNTKK